MSQGYKEQEIVQQRRKLDYSREEDSKYTLESSDRRSVKPSKEIADLNIFFDSKVAGNKISARFLD